MGMALHRGGSVELRGAYSAAGWATLAGMRGRALSLVAIAAMVAMAVVVPGCGGDDVSEATSVSVVGTTSTSSSTSTSSTSTSTTSTSTTTTLVVPTEPCARIAFDVAARTPGSTQVIVVRVANATDTVGVLQVADLSPSGGQCGSERRARVGRSGVRPLVERRSGDGTTPAGVFPLGVMTAWDGQQFSFFGNSADPGVVAGTYREVQPGDCFGATPNDPDYGHLVQRPQAQCPGPDDEYLPKYTGAYEHAALIGANMEPDVSGDAPGETPYAAAIFLHRQSYDSNGASKPTAGCVSLGLDDLVTVLRSMRPGVQFAIGTEEWLLAGDW